MGPWSPNWRPDPTGQRLVALRIARRGGLLAGLIFAPLVALAVALTPSEIPSLPAFDEGWMAVAGIVALFCAPGIALLGAGLAGSALGPRSSAAVTGLAIAVGVPVAAITSAIIGAFIMAAFARGVGDATSIAGQLLRAGVTAAVRISPLIGVGSVAWVVFVRRFARPTA